MITGLVEGERVNLREISRSDLDEIRKSRAPIACPACRAPMHSRHLGGDRTSGLTDIFAHNPGGRDLHRRSGWEESVEHDALKVRLVQAAQRAGATAELEVMLEDHFQADVVVTLPSGAKWGLEAQLAPLNFADAVERHQHYVDALGNCTWAYTKTRPWAVRIPSFRVDTDTQTSVVEGVFIDANGDQPAEEQPVIEVVPEILTNRLTYVWDPNGQHGYYAYIPAKGGLSRSKRIRGVRDLPQNLTNWCDRDVVVGSQAVTLQEALRTAAVAPATPTQAWFDLAGPPPVYRPPIDISDPVMTTDLRITFRCPRCGIPTTDQFYGPCSHCRLALRSRAVRPAWAAQRP